MCEWKRINERVCILKPMKIYVWEFYELFSLKHRQICCKIDDGAVSTIRLFKHIKSKKSRPMRSIWRAHRLVNDAHIHYQNHSRLSFTHKFHSFRFPRHRLLHLLHSIPSFLSLMLRFFLLLLLFCQCFWFFLCARSRTANTHPNHFSRVTSYKHIIQNDDIMEMKRSKILFDF